MVCRHRIRACPSFHPQKEDNVSCSVKPRPSHGLNNNNTLHRGWIKIQSHWELPQWQNCPQTCSSAENVFSLKLGTGNHLQNQRDPLALQTLLDPLPITFPTWNQLSFPPLILSFSVKVAELSLLIFLLALLCFQGYLVEFIWDPASCLKLLWGRQKTPLIIRTIAAFSGPCGLWNACVGAWSWHVLRCCGWSDAVVLYIFCKDRCSVKPKIQDFALISNNLTQPLALSVTYSLKSAGFAVLQLRRNHIPQALTVLAG